MSEVGMTPLISLEANGRMCTLLTLDAFLFIVSFPGTLPRFRSADQANQATHGYPARGAHSSDLAAGWGNNDEPAS